jgi:hypothetical protein
VTGEITHTDDPAIDDNNLCTTDACDPQTGPSHTPAVSCTFQFDKLESCEIILCHPATGSCFNPNGDPNLKGEAFKEEFADNSQGWTFSAAPGPANEWEIGPATASSGHTAAGPDPATDWMPGGDNGVLGVALGAPTGNASTTPHGLYYATSPIIDLSSYPNNNASNDYPLFLTFFRWLNSAAALQNTVEVWNGNTWVLVAAYNGLQNDTSWQWVNNINIAPYKNQFFQVRFGYSVGNGAPVVSSWNIDNVRIVRNNTYTTCPQ